MQQTGMPYVMHTCAHADPCCCYGMAVAVGVSHGIVVALVPAVHHREQAPHADTLRLPV
jgi:hypothetical protein